MATPRRDMSMQRLADVPEQSILEQHESSGQPLRPVRKSNTYVKHNAISVAAGAGISVVRVVCAVPLAAVTSVTAVALCFSAVATYIEHGRLVLVVETPV
jgi:hypothetical protein